METANIVLSLSGSFFVAISLLMTIKHFRLEKAASYIERLNSPELIETKGIVLAWLGSSDDDRTRLDAIEKDTNLRAHVTAFLNMFTELGVAYEFKLIHRRMSFEVWYPVTVIYWESLEFYIRDQRRQGHEIGNYFERFKDAMLQHHSRPKTGLFPIPQRTSQERIEKHLEDIRGRRPFL